MPNANCEISFEKIHEAYGKCTPTYCVSDVLAFAQRFIYWPPPQKHFQSSAESAYTVQLNILAF